MGTTRRQIRRWDTALGCRQVPEFDTAAGRDWRRPMVASGDAEVRGLDFRCAVPMQDREGRAGLRRRWPL